MRRVGERRRAEAVLIDFEVERQLREAEQMSVKEVVIGRINRIHSEVSSLVEAGYDCLVARHVIELVRWGRTLSALEAKEQSK